MVVVVLKVKQGINDLKTKNPDLSKEWDFEKNSGLTPSDVSYGSKFCAWWICSKCGYSWQAQIYSRNNGNGCPLCGRKKATQKTLITKLKNGQHSLQTFNPPYLIEWDYKKNGNRTPNDVMPNSAKKVWWICQKCHSSYCSRINGRTSEGKGCPVCAGIEVREGINDLATHNPLLAKEWDYEKNKDLLPSQVTVNSTKKVSWKCAVCKYEWIATVSSRNAGNGCPSCAKVYHSSLPEQIIYWYILQQFPDAINGYKPEWLKKYGEIDIFIPSLKIGIEYDGEKWHKNIKRDQNKGKLIKKHEIFLIRIREPKLQSLDDDSYIIETQKIDKQYLYLENVIKELIQILVSRYNIKWTIPINIEKDISEIRAMYIKNKKEKSLAFVCPQIIDEWDYENNKNLKPEQVTAHSDMKVYWICKVCGYKWKAAVGDRTNGHGCPFCAGRAVRTGYNDIATMRPELIKKWNYEKNGDLKPENVSYRSDKKIWWHCDKCGYDFQQRIADTSNGTGCPVCSGRKIISGFNDLATDNPELAKEWDYHKNKEFTPSMIAPQSNKKVWWICSKCGNSWCATVYSRNGNHHGCPVCGKKKHKKT